MAINYAKARASSIKGVSENGRNVVLRSFTTSGDDWNPVQVPVDTTVKALQSRFDAKEIDGTLIRTDDKLFLIAGGADIGLAKRLIDGGVDYEVVNVREVKPGAVSILWKVQVRL